MEGTDIHLRIAHGEPLRIDCRAINGGLTTGGHTEPITADLIVIGCSLEPCVLPWTMLSPLQTPSTLKNPDVLGRMLSGEIVQVGAGPLWYRAVTKADLEKEIAESKPFQES